MRIPKEFITICTRIGNEYTWVQGTGGNISVKVSDTEMLIKASGMSISDIRDDKGLVKVRYREILRSIAGNSKDAEYDKILNNASDNGLRPSMETVVHSVLGKYVVHTHPVSVNMIACLEEGEYILRKILGVDFIWVKYCAPGAELSREIFRIMKNYDVSRDLVIIMQNHGMIISTEDITRNFGLNREVISKADKYLEEKNLPRYCKDALLDKGTAYASTAPVIKEYMKLDNKLRFVFPDAVVFGHNVFTGQDKSIRVVNDDTIVYEMEKQKAEKVNSMLTLHMYFMVNLSGLGKFNTLNEEDVQKILDMESEKHREKMLK